MKRGTLPRMDSGSPSEDISHISVAACFLPDGLLLVAEPLIHSVRLSVLTPHDGTILRCVEIPTPELCRPITLAADPHGVWIIDESDIAIRLTLPDFMIARQHAFSALLSKDEQEGVICCCLSSDGAFFWLEVRCGALATLHIIDTKYFEVRTKLIGYKTGQPIHDGSNSCLLAAKQDGGIVLLDSAGTTLWEKSMLTEFKLSAATAHPDDGNYVLLVRDSNEMGRDELSYCRFSNSDALSKPQIIADSECDVYSQVATAARNRLIFVCYPNSMGESILLALHAAGKELIEKYSVRIPRDFLLVPNHEEKTVMGLYRIGSNFHPMDLGHLPPKTTLLR